MEALELMQKNKIVEHLAGSHAYGTNIATSDLDKRGLFLGDPINIRTPFYQIRECNVVSEEDTKFYELTHFMKLLLDCNPNIVETLWVDDLDIIYKDSMGVYDHLRENNYKFLSSKVAHTFSGYAHAQIKRIRGHNKWINNPKDKTPPRQIDYVSMVQNFTNDKLFKIDLQAYKEGHRLVPYGREIFGLFAITGYETFDKNFKLNTTFEGDRSEYTNPLMILKFNKEEYKRAMEEWTNYWQWKRNRNVVRGEMESKYGYDCKHAMHCVRLLRMGLEILRDGVVNVKRADADELLSIREGEWAFNEIISYSQKIDSEIKIWYDKTALPKKPNIRLASTILMDCQDMMWNL